MKRALLGMTTSILTLGLAFGATTAQADDMQASAVDEQLQEYREAAQTFGKRLKGELQAAMKSGGPMAGIEICHARAPEIAAEISEETGFRMRRTSLQPRATPPTAWEAAVLQEFETRRAAGADLADIEWHTVSKTNGEPQLRYMKAIGTQAVCLTCHGENVDPDLLAKINKLYPNDQATGFREGDIRGAFSITATLDD